jgi:drug/metabolite transporter (DMT)-like permease
LTGKSQLKTAYPLGHLLRGLVGVLMLFAVGECFREMQLADAYTLFFAAPLLVTLLSGPVMGEPAGLARIVAAVIGFSGVLLVLQPTAGNWISYGAMMGLIGMVAYAGTTLLLRRLGSRDGTVTIAFWYVTIVGVISGILAVPEWTPLMAEHWPILLVLGVSGTGGQVLITAALRRASVAVVAPLDYTHMIWAVVYGLAFWGYLPGWRVWLGASVIMLSGIFIIFRENRLRLKRALEQESGFTSH